MRAEFKKERIKLWQIKIMETVTHLQDVQSLRQGSLFTREDINSRIISLGATASNSVTRKTNYLICGAKPGSKLVKAREIGMPVLTEQEFLKMVSA